MVYTQGVFNPRRGNVSTSRGIVSYHAYEKYKQEHPKKPEPKIVAIRQPKPQAQQPRPQKTSKTPPSSPYKPPAQKRTYVQPYDTMLIPRKTYPQAYWEKYYKEQQQAQQRQRLAKTMGGQKQLKHFEARMIQEKAIQETLRKNAGNPLITREYVERKFGEQERKLQHLPEPIRTTTRIAERLSGVGQVWEKAGRKIERETNVPIASQIFSGVGTIPGTVASMAAVPFYAPLAVSEVIKKPKKTAVKTGVTIGLAAYSWSKKPTGEKVKDVARYAGTVAGFSAIGITAKRIGTRPFPKYKTKFFKKKGKTGFFKKKTSTYRKGMTEADRKVLRQIRRRQLKENVQKLPKTPKYWVEKTEKINRLLWKKQQKLVRQRIKQPNDLSSIIRRGMKQRIQNQYLSNTQKLPKPPKYWVVKLKKPQKIPTDIHSRLLIKKNYGKIANTLKEVYGGRATRGVPRAFAKPKKFKPTPRNLGFKILNQKGKQIIKPPKKYGFDFQKKGGMKQPPTNYVFKQVKSGNQKMLMLQKTKTATRQKALQTQKTIQIQKTRKIVAPKQITLMRQITLQKTRLKSLPFSLFAPISIFKTKEKTKTVSLQKTTAIQLIKTTTKQIQRTKQKQKTALVSLTMPITSTRQKTATIQLQKPAQSLLSLTATTPISITATKNILTQTTITKPQYPTHAKQNFKPQQQPKPKNLFTGTSGIKRKKKKIKLKKKKKKTRIIQKVKPMINLLTVFKLSAENKKIIHPTSRTAQKAFARTLSNFALSKFKWKTKQYKRRQKTK